MRKSGAERLSPKGSVAGLISESEFGLYGAACRCNRPALQCGRRPGVAGCHHLLRPYLPRFSVHRVPPAAGDSITVHITLTPNDLNSAEVSLLWHFTTRRPTRVTLVRARRSRLGPTRLCSVAVLASPQAWLAVGKDPPNAEHTLGAGQRLLEARSPSSASPAPRPAGHTRYRVPQTHTPARSVGEGERGKPV